jgi:hypothetical protein
LSAQGKFGWSDLQVAEWFHWSGIGFHVFMVGLLIHDRQLKSAQRHVSSLNQTKP